MRPVPRVRCDDCRFEWYGASAADGLRVVRSCPRCDGHLEFLAEDQPHAAFALTEREARLAPAAVLGMPTSWSR